MFTDFRFRLCWSNTKTASDSVIWKFRHLQIRYLRKRTSDSHVLLQRGWSLKLRNFWPAVNHARVCAWAERQKSEISQVRTFASHRVIICVRAPSIFLVSTGYLEVNKPNTNHRIRIIFGNLFTYNRVSNLWTVPRLDFWPRSGQSRAKPENTRGSPEIFATWRPWNTISSTLT